MRGMDDVVTPAGRHCGAASRASVLSLKVWRMSSLAPCTSAARNQSCQPWRARSATSGSVATSAALCVLAATAGVAIGNSASSISRCAVSPGQWPGPWRIARSGPPSSKRVSAISVSIASLTCGCTAENAGSRGSSQVLSSECRVVMRTRSRSSWLVRNPSSVLSTSASALPAASASSRPSGVRFTPRAWRWNRVTPSRASSLRT
jgi:hypothetical protein